MIFSEFIFFVFFPIVLITFYGLPKKYSLSVLFLSSYVFYASWNYKYLLLIFTSVIVNYWVGLILCGEENRKRKNIYLFIAIAANLSFLAFFKYYNFFVDIINDSTNGEISYLNIILPVGISFYTFQAISYVVDIYRGEIAAEKSFLKFSTYIAFFPQLVAGPIVRGSVLLPQLHKLNTSFDYKNIKEGAAIFLIGLLKKKMADVIAFSIVDPVFSSPDTYSAEAIVIATIFFAVQIYFDFSGYTDMAIGCAKTLNIKLPVNFNYPYLAKSCGEFWTRWHITLSTWLRDYLYIPLGGNRYNLYRNILIVMILGGVWHGADYTFMLWGAYHGLILVIEKRFNIPEKVRNNMVISLFYMVFTWCLLLFSWLIFRASSFSELVDIVNKIIFLPYTEGQSIHVDLVAQVIFCFFLLQHVYGYVKESYSETLHKYLCLFWGKIWVVRGLVFTLICIFSIIWSEKEANPFIYFQF